MKKYIVTYRRKFETELLTKIIEAYSFAHASEKFEDNEPDDYSIVISICLKIVNEL